MQFLLLSQLKRASKLKSVVWWVSPQTKYKASEKVGWFWSTYLVEFKDRESLIFCNISKSMRDRLKPIKIFMLALRLNFYPKSNQRSWELKPAYPNVILWMNVMASMWIRKKKERSTLGAALDTQESFVITANDWYLSKITFLHRAARDCELICSKLRCRSWKNCVVVLFMYQKPFF